MKKAEYIENLIKNFCIWMLVFLMPYFSVSQNKVLKLKELLKRAQHDSTKARINGLLAWELRALEPKEALAYANSEIEIGIKNKNFNYLADAYRAKGLILIIAEKMEEGLACYDSSIYYSKQAGNLYYESSCYSLIGGLYGDLGDFHKSIEYYTKGLDLAKAMKNERLIAQNYNNLAEIYQNTGRNTELVQNYLRFSIESSMKMKDWGYAGMSSANLAKEFIRLGKPDKAETEIKRTLDLMFRDTSDTYRFGTTSHVLASTYNDMGKFEEARKFALISIHIMDSLKRPDNALRPLTELTKSYIATKNPDLGKKYAERLIADGFAQNAKLYIRDGYKALSDIAKMKGDFSNALTYYEQYKSWDDSIFEIGREQSISNVEMRAKMAQKELEIRYESEKKISENKGLKEQNATLRSRQLVIFIACIIFSILVTLLYFSNRKKKKINEALEAEKKIVQEQAAEKGMLVHEIHHRVKNNLTMLKGLLYLQGKTSQQEETKRVLNECQARILSMSLVHQSLYEENDTGTIDFDTFMEDLFNELSTSFLPSGKDISFEVTGSKIKLGLAKGIPLALIINELVTNSLKYAFTNAATGKILIEIKKENGRINIHYMDSGAGLPNGYANDKGGFGFKLMNILSRQLNATITYEKAVQFSVFTLEIPA